MVLIKKTKPGSVFTPRFASVNQGGDCQDQFGYAAVQGDSLKAYAVF